MVSRSFLPSGAVQAIRDLTVHDQLDEVNAAALTGAFIGAVTGALQVLLDSDSTLTAPAAVQAAVRRATDVALAPWLQHSPT